MGCRLRPPALGDTLPGDPRNLLRPAMSAHNYLTLAAILAAAMASPGPGVFAVIGRALLLGWRANLTFIFGMMLGDLTWATVAMSGLAGVVGHYAGAFVILKLLGGIYLIYLGIRAWRAPVGALDEAHLTNQTGPRALAGGYSLTVSNPKAIVFYLAVLPVAVDLPSLTASDGLTVAAMIAGLLFCVMFGYSLACAQARSLFTDPKRIRMLNRGAGGLMVGVGVLVAGS